MTTLDIILYIIILGLVTNLIANMIFKYIPHPITEKHIDKIISGVLILICVLLLLYRKDEKDKTIIPTQRGSITNAERPGKPPGSREMLSVVAKYHPSGLMGDIGDIIVQRDVGADRFVYETGGRGPHEWEYKYVNGELNNTPAKFAGVMYLDPPNNWGQVYGGFDLRGLCGAVKWEAHSLGEDVVVEFVIGGIDWVWDELERKRVTPPYQDSLPRTQLGIYKLTQNWQSFKYSLLDQPSENFLRVMGGFGWVINWGSNGVTAKENGTSSESPKTFIIEIRNIRYERK